MTTPPSRDVQISWLEVLCNPVQLDIIRALVELEEATAAELSERTHNGTQVLRRHLRVLADRGVISESRGPGEELRPGRPATRYRLYADLHAAARSLLEILAQPLDSWRGRNPWR